jgi:hypothetical protein
MLYHFCSGYFKKSAKKAGRTSEMKTTGIVQHHNNQCKNLKKYIFFDMNLKKSLAKSIIIFFIIPGKKTMLFLNRGIQSLPTP